MMLSWDNAAASERVCACLHNSGKWTDIQPYVCPLNTRHTSWNSRHLLTSEQQNLDILSTFSGRKYYHLDIIQNPATLAALLKQLPVMSLIISSVKSPFFSIHWKAVFAVTGYQTAYKRLSVFIRVQ